MKPWCAEGEVPTAANLNLYLGLHPCVGWHCDEDPLFGGAGCSKLIVSVNFGSQAPFQWKDKSCLDGDVSLCSLSQGYTLARDGQCQDEFLDCTDPGLEQERINVTFRWMRQHITSCPLRVGVVWSPPTCAQGFSATVMENWGFSGFFFCFVGAPWVLCVLGMLVFWCSLDTFFGRRSAGALFS